MAWKLLGKHMSRCAELVLDTHDADLGFEDIPDLSFPQLTSFHRKGDGLPRPCFIEALSRAPSLAQLSSWCTYPRDSTPYSQLTHLEVVYVSSEGVEELLDVLFACTRLDILELCIVESDHLAGRKVSMPSLRKLTIGRVHDMIHGDFLSALFQCFRLPSLVRLELNAEEWSLVTSVHMAAMLESCSATLREVVIHVDTTAAFESPSSHSPNHPLVTALRPLSHLNRLEFYVAQSFYFHPLPSFDNFVAPFLTQLRPDSNSARHLFLPTLKWIVVDVEGVVFTSQVMETLLQTASSRQLAGLPFAELHCILDEAEEPFVVEHQMAEQIKELERKGTRIVLKQGRAVLHT
ncbi:hypothetical protein V5O48_006342 [Marasmius crinis-equi]|uniref:F-box domain-containing protein n=1 Tax=Marasmius crinis-equi TaxID=585013 RepID=A0ABR3FJQ5_9AGAR